MNNEESTVESTKGGKRNEGDASVGRDAALCEGDYLLKGCHGDSCCHCQVTSAPTGSTASWCPPCDDDDDDDASHTRAKRGIQIKNKIQNHRLTGSGFVIMIF